MSSTRVAVIVPVFNRAVSVLEALDSIAGQTRRPDRVVVVDDGSTDGSGDAVERWIGKAGAGLDVRLIRQANQGAALARNRAAEETRDCPLMAFLDSDDLWPEDYLQRVAAALEREPEVVAASVDQLHVDSGSGETYFYDLSIYDGPSTSLLVKPQVPPVPSCTIVRTELFHRLGGFDPAYVISQDRHFFMRLSLLGPWRYVPGLPITYRRNQAGQQEGASQLTQRMYAPDQGETWWAMVRRFVFEQGGDTAVPRRAIRGTIAEAFIELGKLRMRRGEFDKAAVCFSQSLVDRPLSWSARRRRAKAKWRAWRQRRRDARKAVITWPALPASPRIGVVIPAYCRAGVVCDALDSAARQTLQPTRIVVVDDGSTDGTADRVAQWIDRHPGLDVALIRQANAGTGAARNRGVEALGQVDLLAFLDSDDLWPADFLERGAAVLASAPTAVAAHADLRFHDLETGSVQYHDQSRFTGWITDALFDLLWQLTGDRLNVASPPPIPVSSVLRAEAFARAGGFDPRWPVRSDLDMFLRLSTLGPWVHFAGEPAVHRRNVGRQRGGAEQLTRGIFSLPQRVIGLQLMEDFLDKHGVAAQLPVALWRMKLMRRARGMGYSLIKQGRRGDAAPCLAIAERAVPWYRPIEKRKVAIAHQAVGKSGGTPVSPPAPATRPAMIRPSPQINALDYFHKLADRHLDKQWGLFVIPIDSEHNDTSADAPFRHQNLYKNRYAMPYKTIEGWFGYWDLLDEVVAGARDGARFVELGVAWGCATVYLASRIKVSGKRIRHACVDLWPEQIDYEKFRENLRLAQVQDRVQSMRMSFASAARHFEPESLDFIFVDGGHEYEDVIADIQTWWPRLRPGGVMAGDDWCATWPGVERAVRELLPQATFVPTHFWMARKA